MENVEWKVQALEVLDRQDILEFLKLDEDMHLEVVDAMIEFAQIACEEQKKICAERVNLLVKNRGSVEDEFIVSELEDVNKYFGDQTQVEVNYKSILNSPTVNFEV